ncbi:uncharacterized protein [Aquarana catesbeiana]
MNTYEEKAMCNLKAFVVKKALKGGRQWREEGKKWEKEVKKRKKEEKKRKKEEKKRKKEIEYAKLHLKAQRTKIMLKVFKTKKTARRRKLMHQVVAHRLINKVPSSCPAEMRNRIPARAEEEKEVQMQHCEKILERSDVPREEKKVQKESLFRRFRKLFCLDKTSESSKTTKVAIVNTNQESQEMPREEPKNMKHQNVAAWRMKLMEKLSDTNDPAEKREIMHQVVAHKLINKVPSPCSAEMHRRIPSIAMEHEEEKIHHFKNIFHWSHSFSKGEKKVQNENLLGDKTSGRKKITKKIHALRKEAAQQKETVEKEKGKDKIEEKKLVMEEEKKMEKDETNTFNEEEKRRVGEEVEAKLKNERKVKAMRDRIQRMKLYEKMTDTEDPEEKRKLMQQVITHRMINKIGVPCTGKRRDSILCSEEEKKKVQKDVQRESQVLKRLGAATPQQDSIAM